jgi:hypothetical protein
MPVSPIPQPPSRIQGPCSPDETDIITTNLYRFSGYKFVRDITGNILFSRVPATETEPTEWAARALRFGNLDLRAP